VKIMKHSVSVMLLVFGLVGSGIVLMHDVREAQAAVRAPVRAARWGDIEKGEIEAPRWGDIEKSEVEAPRA
jgi:hypothetical protein